MAHERTGGPRRGVTARLGFPAERAARPYGLAVLVNYLGTGLFYPFVLLFFHHQLGVPLPEAGACYAAAVGIGVLGASRTGSLVDRFGSRRALVADSLVRAAVFLYYPYLHNLAAFVVLATLVALADRTDQVATQTLVGELAPADSRRSWLALNRMMLNVGMGGGALIGGLILTTPDGYAWLVRGDATSFAVTAVLFGTLRKAPAPLAPAAAPSAAAPHAAAAQSASPSSLSRAASGPSPWRDSLFMRLAVLNGMIYLVGLAVEVGLPVYLVAYLHEPGWTVSMVFAINTGLVALFQMPVTEWIRLRPPVLMLAAGTAGYATTFLLFLATGHVSGGLLIASLALAVALFTIGELVSSVTGAAIALDLAPAERRGVYLGASQLFIGLASTVAPFLYTAGLALSPSGLWVVLTAIATGVVIAALRLRAPLAAFAAYPEPELAPEPAAAPIPS